MSMRVPSELQIALIVRDPDSKFGDLLLEKVIPCNVEFLDGEAMKALDGISATGELSSLVRIKVKAQAQELREGVTDEFELACEGAGLEVGN